MRSLSKDPEIINAAQQIVNYFKTKFSSEEEILESEIEKLDREHEVLTMMKKAGENN